MKKIFLACIALFWALNLNALEGFYKLEKQPNEYEIKPFHKSLNLECKNCHDMSKKDEGFVGKTSNKTCLECHKSYAHLAQLSANLGYDDNPHASPHYPDMHCSSCHASHKKSRNYCVMCHSQDSLKNLLVP